jgi:hypothetical protein
MPIRIPPEARVVRDARITTIRVISTLYDRVVKGDGGLSARVKATLREKDAAYAESELVFAALRPGSTKGPIDAEKLYELVKDRKLTLKQFLACVSVRKEPLKEYLAGGVIDELCGRVDDPEPSLVTEFKEGVELDVDAIAMMLADAVAKAVPIKAA